MAAIISLLSMALFLVDPTSAEGIPAVVKAAQDAEVLYIFDAVGHKAQGEFCKPRTGHEGYTGHGFCDFQQYGAWLEFLVKVHEPVDVLEVRYSAGHGHRPVDVIIDEKLVGELPMVKTPDWDSWNTERLKIPLLDGIHTVRLYARRSPGPNVDWLALYRLGNPSPQPIVPTQSPTVAPTLTLPVPSSSPVPVNTPAPIPYQSQNAPYAVVLESGGSLSTGEFVKSPNGKYSFGLSYYGDVEMRGVNNEIIWSAGVSESEKCYMQSDGNMVAREANGQATWTSKTHGNNGAFTVVDDLGQIAVLHQGTSIWLAGLPRGEYTGPPNQSLTYPLRGAFYYPWYPETWSVNGAHVFYEPTLGYYSSGNPFAQITHVKALEYAHVDVAIASWWGPNEQKERARITNMMDRSIELGTNVKWTVYHEDESQMDQSIPELQRDLDYLKKWYAWHPAWAHIEGKPLIFVYSTDNDCEVSERWMKAAGDDWYVVLKLFANHQQCEYQPNHWHEYAPAYAVVHKEGFSFSISAGFHRADLPTPRLHRVKPANWTKNVQAMTDKSEDWSLIYYNEWGEGTAIESAEDWADGSPHGFYMRVLHEIY